MRTSTITRLTVLAPAALAAFVACNDDVSVFGNPAAGAGGAMSGPTSTTSVASGGGSSSAVTGTGGATTATTSGSSTATTSGPTTTGGGMGGAGGSCELGPDDDVDQDGFTPNDGDCDECDPRVNPNAIEILGDTVDDDCDGDLSNEVMPCDGMIPLDATFPLTAISAIELCKVSNDASEWGVAAAAWVLPDGSPPPTNEAAAYHLGHGVMSSFGPNVLPRGGSQLLVLSDGNARIPGDVDFQSVTQGNKNYEAPLPPGFPNDAPSCGQTTSGPTHDPVAIQAIVRAPSNATGFSFHFDFYAADFPDYICSQFDDQFVALVNPAPAGAIDGNVAFNGMNEIFSVNGAIFDVCTCPSPPCTASTKLFPCSQGPSRLVGTGYGADVDADRAATGWQLTTVPVEPGSQFVVRFAIWDMADGVFTASALIDDWRWLTEPNVVVQTTPDP